MILHFLRDNIVIILSVRLRKVSRRYGIRVYCVSGKLAYLQGVNSLRVKKESIKLRIQAGSCIFWHGWHKSPVIKRQAISPFIEFKLLKVEM